MTNRTDKETRHLLIVGNRELQQAAMRRGYHGINYLALADLAKAHCNPTEFHCPNTKVSTFTHWLNSKGWNTDPELLHDLDRVREITLIAGSKLRMADIHYWMSQGIAVTVWFFEQETSRFVRNECSNFIAMTDEALAYFGDTETKWD